MPRATYPTYGTGLFGSLTYSSTPSSAAARSCRAPRSPRNSCSGFTSAGGHALSFLNSFTPVANTYALGNPAGNGASFRWCMNQGNWISLRKYSAVLIAKARFPSVLPSPRDQPPCDQGPMTSRFSVLLLFFWMLRNMYSGPMGSSASNHPPTFSTAGATLVAYFQSDRACQNWS